MPDQQQSETIKSPTEKSSDYLGVKLPTDLMERIKREAKRDGRTVSSYVRFQLGNRAAEILTNEK
jgi:hypothetical protein